MTATFSEQAAALLLRELGEADERSLCAEHPAHLLDRVKAIDAKTGEHFQFELLNPLGWKTDGHWITPPDSGERNWTWQRVILDWWLAREKTIVLKARQLGVTWLAGGLALWYLLFRPGSNVLIYSMTEDDAAAVVGRIWDMLESLPAHLRPVEILKPARGARPHTDIIVRHKDGRVSAIHGMAATKKAGQGRTAALVILDELARQEYAREIWKSTIPTMADGGRIVGISTANGVSNDLTGEGNFFHHLWVHSDELNVETRFLGWQMHPDRDDKWFAANAMSLPPKDRAEQYPSDPQEAFILTGDQYFDAEGLGFYAKNGVHNPLYRMRFVRTAANKAKRQTGDGWIRVYEEPVAGRDYAIAADVATGRGTDYSAAYVIDLSSMGLVAEFHGKLDADQYAFQLHYLGRWYNTARIAIEQGGGYGEAPIVLLRDGKEGRPAYPKLYRHRQFSRGDLAEHKPFGFPMTSKTRPLVLEGLERAIRERVLPWLSDGLLMEMQTFVHAKTNPSPRAQDGCNDDRVMAAAIAVEMFRQYGTHPDRKFRRPRRPKPAYPWLDSGSTKSDFDSRYPGDS